MIDLNTYDKTPAAEVLAMMINETGYSNNKIGSIFNSFSKTLNELKKIDSKIGIGLSKLSFEKHKQRCLNLESKFNTYTLNVLKTQHKIWLEEQKASIPYKIRKLKQ